MLNQLHRLPADYPERVYAGVLGKVIGVYLGRPFEGWMHDRILRELGEVHYYVNERLNVPLVVTDDDISGTFTFLRALEDHGGSRELSAEQIGQTWLNYIIENRTILWWGGMGLSTEHTAYLRLKRGVPAPRSGSMAMNSKVVAEQIGAQIFIDGWAMVAPGDPALAADLARRAGSVSHDGEAIYAARVVAAIEAAAFVQSDIEGLLDVAVSLIPAESIIAQMIADLRDWRRTGIDWRSAFRRLDERYGYHKYGGNCHTVPNHGVIILALLWGEGEFQKSLMIANTCGWDTDCNSGNVGCILGIRNGLAGIDDGPDWRGPVADRLLLPTADGGRTISDAASEAMRIVNMGRSLAGEPPLRPKEGARFHFTFPGSVQGFRCEDTPESRDTAQVDNAAGQALRITFSHVAPGRPARVATGTFIPPDAVQTGSYALLASPTLYPGQTVRAVVQGSPACQVRLFVRAYGERDALILHGGPLQRLQAGESADLRWTIPATVTGPIAAIGLEVAADRRSDGEVLLHALTWDGVPTISLQPPGHTGEMWKRAWVNGCDSVAWLTGESPDTRMCRLIQNEGTGLLIQGTREWANYRVETRCTPHLVESAGIAAHVQGMRRYYSLRIRRDGRAQLVKMLHEEIILAEASIDFGFTRTFALSLQILGTRITGRVDGRVLLEADDIDHPLTGGAVALLCEEGRAAFGAVLVSPV